MRTSKKNRQEIRQRLDVIDTELGALLKMLKGTDRESQEAFGNTAGDKLSDALFIVRDADEDLT